MIRIWRYGGHFVLDSRFNDLLSPGQHFQTIRVYQNKLRDRRGARRHQSFFFLKFSANFRGVLELRSGVSFFSIHIIQLNGRWWSIWIQWTKRLTRLSSQFADFVSIFEIVEKGQADFVYISPNLMSCFQSEFDVAPILTLRNFRLGSELNR